MEEKKDIRGKLNNRMPIKSNWEREATKKKFARLQKEANHILYIKNEMEKNKTLFEAIK